MTRKEAIRRHRAMWRWLAKHPGKMKWDYLEKFDPKAELKNECYLCEYTSEYTGKYDAPQCNHCPLEWAGRSCMSPESLYNEWCHMVVEIEDYTRAAEIARQIAELPERNIE